MKPFLKWPGGKYRLRDRICARLGPGKRLIEPFTGSAAVFLNSDFPGYLLADSNPDLINLYLHLTEEGRGFIRYCGGLFTGAYNNPDAYYRLREEFNTTTRVRRKSALFLYLNRHGYNGLVRYNRKGGFNVPFGRYRGPYFPERELENFLQAARRASFLHGEFPATMALARRGDVVYCDPPYAPISATADFTDYCSGGFSWQDQEKLAGLAAGLAGRGIPVVISNHATPEIRALYRAAGAAIEYFQVHRSISRDIRNRAKVGELLAVFG